MYFSLIIIIIKMIIVIPIFKEDNVFSMNTNLPYSPQLTTGIDYFQAFC